MGDHQSMLTELQRRHVVRAGIGHLVFFWLLVQVADVVLPYVGVVENPVRWAIVAAVALFPVTLVVAWFTEHPWHRYTSSRLAIDVALIVGIGITAFTWVRNNIPEIAHARTSIVVMPFEYRDDDPQGRFLSRAMALQVNSLLMKSRSIDVVGYESANSPLLRGLDILDVIRELDVQHVLSGVISSANASMNVSLKLHDHDGNQIWTSELTDAIENLPGVQERIATQVQNRLGETGTGITVAQLAEARCPMPTDVSALERYYTARHYVASRTGSEQSNQELREAVRLYEDLIDEYPRFAQAFSGLAWARRYQVTYDPEFNDRQELEQSTKSVVNKALELCPALGEALVLVGNQADHPNKWINNEQNLALWRELQPDASEPVEQYIHHLTFVGRNIEALKLAEENYRLNPLSVRSIKMLKYAYMHDERVEEAVELEKLEEELGSTSPRFAEEMSQRKSCMEDLECLLTSLPPDFAPFADQLRTIYTPPKDNEQQKLAIDTAMQLVEMTEGGVLNWFNGSSCNFEHLTPLFFRLWDRYTGIMTETDGEAGWYWYWPNAWANKCQQVWGHEEFPLILEQDNLVEYFRSKGWADPCRPDDEGDGFSCSGDIWSEKRAAAGL